VGASCWADLKSLILAARLAPSAPLVIFGAGRHAAQCARAFNRTVMPLLDDSITDAKLRGQLAETMLTYVTTTYFVVAGYARMAGVPLDSDLAVLGLSFARLYDDLLDEHGGRNFPQRVEALFVNGKFTPIGDLEFLLKMMHGEIDRRLDRDRSDPVYAAAIALHRYQVRSDCQRDTQAPLSTLTEITKGKGGHGTLAVFALMRPRISPSERLLIMDLGEIFQMLDDYCDVERDCSNGVRTTATEGYLGLSEICRRLRAARRPLNRYYGRRHTREFCGICYVTACICFLRRRWPKFGSNIKPVLLKLSTAIPWRIARPPVD
jgi:hypothetical protein